jgi:DNA-directed RNA polymerase specialized sigma24 family protein
LSAVEQMDYRSIAAALHVPIGTVRSRLSRSRRALRDVLIRTLPEAYHGLLPR